MKETCDEGVRMKLGPAVIALLAMSQIGNAQSGRGAGGCHVAAGFECALVHAHDSRGNIERYWIRAVVLWRGDSSAALNAQFDTADARVRNLKFTAARRAAEDSARTLVGTAGSTHFSAATMTWGFDRARTRDTLFVEGQRLEIPERDSAMVVMIDMPPAGSTSTPRIVGIAWISADLDQGYWPKSWRSGDTSFMVMPRRDNDIMRTALMKSPQIRAFLLGKK